MLKTAANATNEGMQCIRDVRGHRVLLDTDLAGLYGVEVRVLNQAVKRNKDRFPQDFMFQLTAEEAAHLRSQSVISSWGGARTRPHAFTEQGVAMLSSVLRSTRAIQVNIELMRAFVRLRAMMIEHGDLERRLNALEAKYDKQFGVVFEALRQLMLPPAPRPGRRIGFRQDKTRDCPGERTKAPSAREPPRAGRALSGSRS